MTVLVVVAAVKPESIPVSPEFAIASSKLLVANCSPVVWYQVVIVVPVVTVKLSGVDHSL